MINSKSSSFISRYIFLVSLIGLASIIFGGRLLNMQIANTDYYKEMNNYSRTVLTNVTAVRGDIYDRNGELLVTNENYYKLVIDGGALTPKTYKKVNEVIGTVIGLCKAYNVDMAPDGLPVLSYTGEDGTGWAYSMELDSNATLKNRLSKFLAQKKLPPETTASELMDYLVTAYSLEGMPPDYVRKMAGVWYDFERVGLFSGAVYTLAEDVTIGLMSAIAERTPDLSGIRITQGTRRIYLYPDAGAHLIGRVGPIFAEEYDAYEALGYTMDAIVGKEGAEKAFEEYLRGQDGILATVYDSEGNILKQSYRQEPVAGRDIYLTLDIKMQLKAQEYLKATVERIRSERKPEEPLTGEDASAGSMVAVNPNNGEVLACATYPSYNLATYGADYKSLSEDPLRPLFNRAVSGQYPPGSIFKTVTALTSLMEGKLKITDYITDKGVYTVYPDYQPKCWIWKPDYPRTHGTINVTQALRDSCNYFFFTVIDRMGYNGITKLNEYSRKLGLGVPTGFELSENVGKLAGREERASRDMAWYSGDTLQAAIGQSDNAFTPLQMATMIGALANGGTRYETHLLMKVENYADQSISFYKPTTIMDRIDIPQEYLTAIKQGMGQVVEDGSVKNLFAGLPYTAGAKTGTAQIYKNKSDLATFVTFAPFDSPEIAISVVIEQGYKGASAGYAARDLLNWYFNVNDIQNAPQETTTENGESATTPTEGSESTTANG